MRARTSRRRHGEGRRGGGVIPARARGDHDDHLSASKTLGPSDAHSRQSRRSTSMSPRSTRPSRTRATELVSTSRARTREMSTRARPTNVRPAFKTHPARSRCASAVEREARGHATAPFRTVLPAREKRAEDGVRTARRDDDGRTPPRVARSDAKLKKSSRPPSAVDLSPTLRAVPNTPPSSSSSPMDHVRALSTGVSPPHSASPAAPSPRVPPTVDADPGARRPRGSRRARRERRRRRRPMARSPRPVVSTARAHRGSVASSRPPRRRGRVVRAPRRAPRHRLRRRRVHLRRARSSRRDGARSAAASAAAARASAVFASAALAAASASATFACASASAVRSSIASRFASDAARIAPSPRRLRRRRRSLPPDHQSPFEPGGGRAHVHGTSDAARGTQPRSRPGRRRRDARLHVAVPTRARRSRDSSAERSPRTSDRNPRRGTILPSREHHAPRRANPRPRTVGVHTRTVAAPPPSAALHGLVVRSASVLTRGGRDR